MGDKFPKGFLWGAATSSHQVEGGTFNDWSEWEKENSERLAKEAGKKWQDWQKRKFLEMLQADNYISGKACDHYHRFEEDFDLAKEGGHNAHRFSIEWSRIEPEEGKFDEKEIEHYRQVVSALRERGIEPFVTLWHWPIPIWFRDQGGWESAATVKYFSRYVEKVVSSLGADVNFWITINEPEIFSSMTYLSGQWPPQKKKPVAYLKIIKNLIKAHKAAYGVIKKINSKAQAGIAKNNIYFEAAENKWTNRLLKEAADWWWNFYFLNKIKKHQDFIGLNHYFHNRINYGFNKNDNEKVSDFGWEIYPEAIYRALMDLKKYAKPIYITENGLADAADEKREWFLREYLKNIKKAMDAGAEVKGYFYWSLLDNFEWDKGFWPRFGLIEIDYKTLERKPRPSFYAYKKIIESNSLE